MCGANATRDGVGAQRNLKYGRRKTGATRSPVGRLAQDIFVVTAKGIAEA